MNKYAKQVLRNHYVNLRGWTTNERLVVFESDDWGSYRIPGLEAQEYLSSSGVKVDTCPYMSFDALATDEDLEALFSLLRSYRDRENNPVVFTANALMFNPDFTRIIESDFQSYFAHNLEESFNLTSATDSRYRNNLGIWKQGLRDGVFVPQLHGAEHLQVNRWLKYIKRGNDLLRNAAHQGFWGISAYTTTKIEKSLQASLHIDSPEDKEFAIERIKLATEEFRRVFDFSSRTFIPPNYTWFEDIEKSLLKSGVISLQSGSVQNLVDDFGTIRKVKAHTGMQKASGIGLTIRNVDFEPSDFRSINTVSTALKQIETAFLWKKPAIVSSHRMNYVSANDPTNGKRSLEALSELLMQIVKRWPDARFLSSAQLAEQIFGSNK